MDWPKITAYYNKDTGNNASHTAILQRFGVLRKEAQLLVNEGQVPPRPVKRTRTTKKRTER
jgi:hypothetical protein